MDRVSSADITDLPMVINYVLDQSLTSKNVIQVSFTILTYARGDMGSNSAATSLMLNSNLINLLYVDDN